MNNRAISIAVVDDEADSLRSIQAVLAEALAGAMYSVSLYEDAETFFAGLKKHRFDLVLLDILMPGKNGLELAREIYEENENSLVAFITFSPDFAVDGYGMNTVGYLLKPPTVEKIHGVLELCRERWSRQSQEESVVLMSGRETVRLAARGVIFLESDNKTVTFQTDNGPLEWRGTMNELMRYLPEGFIRVHQSFAVNRERVFRLRGGKMLMDNGKEVPVSRAYRKSVSDAFLGFLVARAGKPL